MAWGSAPAFLGKIVSPQQNDALMMEPTAPSTVSPGPSMLAGNQR